MNDRIQMKNLSLVKFEICAKPYAGKATMVEHVAICKGERNTSES